MPFCIFPVIYHFGPLFGNFDFDSFNSSELGIVDININFDVQNMRKEEEKQRLQSVSYVNARLSVICQGTDSTKSAEGRTFGSQI